MKFTETEKKLIGDRIKERRKICGLSQKKLAENMHLDERCIYNYEHAKRTPDDEKRLEIAKQCITTFEYISGKSEV